MDTLKSDLERLVPLNSAGLITTQEMERMRDAAISFYLGLPADPKLLLAMHRPFPSRQRRLRRRDVELACEIPEDSQDSALSSSSPSPSSACPSSTPAAVPPAGASERMTHNPYAFAAAACSPFAVEECGSRRQSDPPRLPEQAAPRDEQAQEEPTNGSLARHPTGSTQVRKVDSTTLGPLGYCPTHKGVPAKSSRRQRSHSA